MYCNKCGAPLNAGAQFCSACGQAAPAAAVPAVAVALPGTRVQRHRTVLVVLWLVYSLYRLGAAMFLIGLGRFAGSERWFNYDNPWWHGPTVIVPGIVGSVLGIAGVFLIVEALAGFAAGIGLYQLAPWARIWAIVLAFLTLLHPLLGTALGIYTLWVLLPSASDAEYSRLAQGTARSVV